MAREDFSVARLAHRAGQIDNGQELFGSYTPQPESVIPNGFLALAEFDKAENGGNGDGVIDSNDAVFSKLRLWIDWNHDGVSTTNEIYSLADYDIKSLGLEYRESQRKDQFGNGYRFRAKVVFGEASQSKQVWAYDIYFLTSTQQVAHDVIKNSWKSVAMIVSPRNRNSS